MLVTCPAAQAADLGGLLLLVAGAVVAVILMTRGREEAKRIGTRKGTLRGITLTGSVITSAGVVLAVVPAPVSSKRPVSRTSASSGSAR